MERNWHANSCLLAVVASGLAACGGGGSSTTYGTTGGFASWGAIRPNTTVAIAGLSQEGSYRYDDAGLAAAPIVSPATPDSTVSLREDLGGELVLLSIATPTGTVGFSTADGDTILVVGGVVEAETAEFTASGGDRGAFYAGIDAEAAGWDYQTFGMWGTDDGAGNASLGTVSYGRVTPASALPATGSARYLGAFVGFYVGPTGTGEDATGGAVRVDVDFGLRTLAFATSGTLDSSGAARPELELRGSDLAYAAGSNDFSGTLANAGGTMSGPVRGRFYGPAAEELGGVFAVEAAGSWETYGGAFGARR
ncbi:MAG: transferrin-binding protein-like solute binding protein [Thauera phenolivorans]|uniref:Transferrin-binding protein-like solute binding protein n=1 Tax=Thauera phenolivorans TaxID=1792543 RepID=A0A7X7LVE9_9RHOO|nr:transferrin-binding protein-like solute binding protein [Thauera phenolivorans]NLF53934.1 transferrin-binding protein-like solute binding protein [Thauera phenolivorans]